MKKLLILMAAIALVFTLTACDKDEKAVLAEKYGTITEDNIFDVIELDELDAIVASNETVFVFFGSPICSACVNVIPYVDGIAKSVNVDPVYYVDFEYTSELAGQWYDEGKYDFQGTPLVVVFHNGEYVRSNFTNVTETSSYFDEIILMFDEFGNA